jgi:16S rRNA (cytosine967-C5)-methyltransferase
MAARRPAAPARSPSRKPPTRSAPTPAREVALDVLRAVTDRDAYANLLLPALLAERGLHGRDAALATELAYGTLRGRGSYDAVVAACSSRPLADIDPPLLDVLRLGTHQLLATRIGPHAAVATSVALAREVAGGGAAGFANAVLRRVAARDLDFWIAAVAPDRAADPVGYLAVKTSHPGWIVAAVSESLGEEPVTGLPLTEAALAANNTRPLVTLCAVPGLAGPADLAARGGRAARWSPFGAYLDSGDPAAVPEVAQGRAAVQDEASQLAALALARADLGAADLDTVDPGAGNLGTRLTDPPAADPGAAVAEAPVTGAVVAGSLVAAGDRRWLDLCAGPGGKARLLAGLAAGRGARLLAADVREHRARLVRAATAPAGAAAVVVADGTRPAWRAASFDRVIADVPCSGLGALRRRPDARWRKTPADVAALGELQRSLLRTAINAARPGGVIAYVTCSAHVAETRAVVGQVTAARDDVLVLDAPALLGEVPDLACPAPGGRYAQFWPHLHGTDAIFLAVLRRR